MSIALRSLLRPVTLVALASALLTGCVVAPVGRYPSPSYRAPQTSYQGGYAEPAYPAYPAYPSAPPQYQYGDRGYGDRNYGDRYADVRYGTVAAIEPLGYARSGSSGAGAVTGGLIGGVIGHEIGRGMGNRHDGGGAVGAMIGAIGGAVIGDQVERDANRGPSGFRVWIRLDGGGDQSLQMANPGGLRVGERVRFVNGQLQRMG